MLKTHLLWIRAAFLYLLVACVQPVNAQDVPMPYLRNDAVCIFSVDIAEIQKAKALQVLPWEVLSATATDALGFDPLKSKLAWGTFGLPGADGVEVGIQVETNQRFNIQDLNDQLFGETKTSPKSPGIAARSLQDTPLSLIQNKDDLLFGTEATLRRMMIGKGEPHPLLPLLLSGKDTVRIVVHISPLRDLIKDALDEFVGSDYEELFNCLNLLIDDIEHLFIQIDFSNETRFSLQMTSHDATSAQRVADHAKVLIGELFEAAETSFNEQFSYVQVSDSVRNAWREYIARTKDLVGGQCIPKLNDKNVTLEFKDFGTAWGVLMASNISAPMLSSFRLSLPEPKMVQNLKELGLAIHNYHDTNTCFVPRTINDEEGKPLLSWRVALLPYLGEQELYSKFNLDEPWDSAHNKPLLDAMPDFFRNPKAELKNGYTTVVAPFGATDQPSFTIWDYEQASFRQVTDGTSNTILFLEVAAESSVPWTAPEDFDIGEKDILKALGAPPVGGRATFADGSVQEIANYLTDEIITALLSAAGGEVVQIPNR